MLHPTPKILLVLALICPTPALAQSSDEPSDHQRVDELLSPEMKAAYTHEVLNAGFPILLGSESNQ